MFICPTCYNYDKCKDMGYADAEKCANYERRMKPKTQFDRIKVMSVEELAKMYVEAIMQLKGTAELLENANAIQLEEFRKQLFIQAVRWLESEVQEDE